MASNEERARQQEAGRQIDPRSPVKKKSSNTKKKAKETYNRTYK
jgi:hypothetical protein